MADPKPATVSLPANSKWRRLLIGLLLAAGCLSLVWALVGAWGRGLLFDTDRYVTAVAPLPKNQAVANAVGSQATTALFANVDVEGKIREALPPQASFVAAPLASQLRTTTEKLASNIVQSDQFSTVWTTANRSAHQRLQNWIDRPDRSTTTQLADFQLQISGLVGQVGSRLGIADNQALAANLNQPIEVGIDLERFDELRGSLRTVKNSPAVAPAATAALFAVAVAVSRQRRRTVVAAGSAITVSMAIALIAGKVVRTDVVASVSNSLDQQAAAAVWQQLAGPLVSSITTALWAGVILTVGALVIGPYGWANRLRRWVGVNRFGASRLATALQRGRQWVGRWHRVGWLAGVVVSLAILLVAQELTWYGVASAAGYLIAYVALIQIIGAAPPAATKQ